MKKILYLFCFALLVASACSSGSEKTTEVEGPSSENTEMAEDSDDSLDETLLVAVVFAPTAGLAIDTDDAITLSDAGAVEGLVASGSNGIASPALAESWSQVDDTSWEFELRPDVVFHDGAPLNAEAVVSALDFVADSATPPRSIDGIGLQAAATDEMTVKVTTDSPDPILPLRLSSPNTGILSPSAYESDLPDPIGHGTGPFEVVDFQPEQSLTVERFDDYWGETAKLKGATLQFVPEAASRAAAIRAGEVDIAEGIALPDLEAIEQDDALRLETTSLPRTSSLYVNTNKGPLSNPTVRQAVSLAVDQDTIANELLEGQFAPAASYFGPDNDWLSQPETQTDPDEAKSVLEQAGFNTDGSDPDLSLEIWTYPDRPELEDIAVVVQSQLQEVGFTVELTVADYTTLEPQALDGEHDIFVLSRSYYLDIADAGAFLASDFTCEGSYNLNTYCSEEYDAVVAELVEATESSEREAIFAEAATILAEENVGIPIVHDQARIAVSDQVQGFEPDPFERTLLTPSLSLA